MPRKPFAGGGGRGGAVRAQTNNNRRALAARSRPLFFSPPATRHERTVVTFNAHSSFIRQPRPYDIPAALVLYSYHGGYLTIYKTYLSAFLLYGGNRGQLLSSFVRNVIIIRSKETRNRSKRRGWWKVRDFSSFFSLSASRNLPACTYGRLSSSIQYILYAGVYIEIARLQWTFVSLPRAFLNIVLPASGNNGTIGNGRRRVYVVTITPRDWATNIEK